MILTFKPKNVVDVIFDGSLAKTLALHTVYSSLLPWRLVRLRPRPSSAGTMMIACSSSLFFFFSLSANGTRSLVLTLRLCNDDDDVAFGRGRVSETRLAAAFLPLPPPAKNRGMNEPSNPPRNRFLLFHASSNFDGITVTVSWAKKGQKLTNVCNCVVDLLG